MDNNCSNCRYCVNRDHYIWALKCIYPESRHAFTVVNPTDWCMFFDNGIIKYLEIDNE